MQLNFVFAGLLFASVFLRSFHIVELAEKQAVAQRLTEDKQKAEKERREIEEQRRKAEEEARMLQEVKLFLWLFSFARTNLIADRVARV